MPLNSFAVSGYRGLAANLDALAQLNFVYGLNESRKTSLLRAIDLYFRLLSRTVWEVWEGFEYDLDTFYATLSQSDAAFGSGTRFELSGHLADLGEVRFSCELIERRVKVTAEVPVQVGEEFAVLRGRQLHLQQVQARGATAEELAVSQDLFAKARERAERAWEPFRQAGPSRLIAPIALPLDKALRKTLVESWQSLDIARRRSVRSAFDAIAELLGWDAPLEPVGPDELALIRSPRPIMLDDLGSGAQSLVGLVGLAMTSPAPRCLLFSEPEVHANPVVHPKVVALLQAIANASPGMQIFVETHSARLAPAAARIYLVEREGERSTARALAHEDLQIFENRAVDPRPPPMRSMLAHDFTVELSPIVREHLGLRPGDFVYFAEKDGAWRVLTRDQADAEMGPASPDAEALSE